MTTATRNADTSKAALLRRLDERIHELEMDRIGGRVEAVEYESIRANLGRQVWAIEVLAA